MHLFCRFPGAAARAAGCPCDWAPCQSDFSLAAWHGSEEPRPWSSPEETVRDLHCNTDAPPAQSRTPPPCIQPLPPLAPSAPPPSPPVADASSSGRVAGGGESSRSRRQGRDLMSKEENLYDDVSIACARSHSKLVRGGTRCKGEWGGNKAKWTDRSEGREV
eukprot:749274-Hanusia_phi.AAC.2